MISLTELPKNLVIGVAFNAGLSVGLLGTHVLKPLFFLSPEGVAISCGVTAAVSTAALISRTSFIKKYCIIIMSYPMGLASARFLNFQISTIDPLRAMGAAVVILSPLPIFILAILLQLKKV